MIYSTKKHLPPTKFQKFAKSSATAASLPLIAFVFAWVLATFFVVRPVMFVLGLVPTLLVRAAGEAMNFGKDSIIEDLRENWRVTGELLKDTF